MAICSMCYQSREVQPLYFGEERVKVKDDVCRGCRMVVEKVEHFLIYAGWRIHMTMQPRLFERLVLTPQPEPEGRVGEEPEGKGGNPDAEAEEAFIGQAERIAFENAALAAESTQDTTLPPKRRPRAS